ncbi:MAG: class I SAM-dependent methyltransferase [Candidatus Thorarchaeota archaeon]
MKDLDKYYETNRTMWDQLAKINVESKTYRTEDFLNGETTLNSIELEGLGDVTGKSLLHLQCHFGLDTLSWARNGARVTGVDFSSEAISIATDLTKKANLDARFIQSNIYDLPDILDKKFDVVFTSYGALVWLHDLKRWAEIVAHFLNPGGIFYIAEFHPLTWIMDWDDPDDFKMVRNYFSDDSPHEFEVEGSYASSEERIEKQVDYEWGHGLSKILTSIADAGLRIHFYHEFNKMPFQLFQFLKKNEDGYFYYDNPDVQLPLVFSLKATKD